MSARDRFTGSFNGVSEAMRHYPAVLCLWAMGVGAILANHEKLLARLLLEPAWKPTSGNETPQPAVRCLNPAQIVSADDDRAPNGAAWLYAQSHHLRAACRETPDAEAYGAACDKPEYLASLIAMGDADNYGRFPWAGEFMLESHLNVVAQVVEKELAPGWPLLEGGAFGGDLDRAKAAREALHAWIAQYGRSF